MGPEKPEIKKTPLMFKIEASFGKEGQQIEGLIREAYWEKKRKTVDIAAAGIETRSRVDAQELRFQDPFAREVVGSRWTEARKKRLSDVMKAKYADDDFKKRHSDGLRRAWDQLSPEKRSLRMVGSCEGSRKVYQKRVAASLGENYQQTLEELVCSGLSVSEIAAKTGLPNSSIRLLLKKTGLKIYKGTTLNRQTIENRRDLVQRVSETGLTRYLLPNDRLILEMRFGSSGRVTSLQLIGEQLGIRKQRVAQIEARALTVLEKMLAGELTPTNGGTILPRGRTGKIEKSLENDSKKVLEDLVYNQGLTQKEAAQKLNCSEQSVSIWMRRLGIGRREKWQRAVVEKLGSDSEWTLRSWHERLSLDEIAENLECSHVTVARLMEDYGISRKRGPKRGRERWSVSLGENPQETLQMWFNRRMSVKEIAQELGCSYTTAIKILDTAGIERKKHRKRSS